MRRARRTRRTRSYMQSQKFKIRFLQFNSASPAFSCLLRVGNSSAYCVVTKVACNTALHHLVFRHRRQPTHQLLHDVALHVAVQQRLFGLFGQHL